MKKNSKKWMAGDNDVRMNQQRLSNRQLRGAPVFYQHHPQKRVAKVKDVLADQKRGVILGLLLSSEGLWQWDKFVVLQDVKLVRGKGVFLSNSKILKKLGVRRQQLLAKPWLGVPVQNEAGKDFGTLADFIWEYPSGRILGIAVSGGLWQDLQQGFRYLSWQTIAPPPVEQGAAGQQFLIQGEAVLQEYLPEKVW